ncbi:MAG: putative Ig domain-containing protein [Dehalococcoidia bacterium]|nr:putative Ig domain-containing protein [Dehalococcoidia bacterium]
MRTPNFAKGQRLAGFFRLCLCILIALTLATGGMAMGTKPVQAAVVAPAAVNNLALVECVPWAQQFNVTPQCPGSAIFFWTVGVVPGWAHVDPLTGELTCCPGIGTAGTPASNFTILCTEMAPWPSPCWPVVFFAIPVTLQVTVPAPTPPGTPPTCALTINPVFYPVAWEGMPFAMTLTAAGNVGTLNWSATGLPTGLTVNNTTGAVSGIPGPGTCGVYTVTATVTDAGICPGPNCCPPTVNRPFILIVDCWVNYISYLAPGTHTDSFTVRIGPNLNQGQTKVLIDGIQKATLGANQSQTFSTKSDELHLVTVDQTVVPGTDPNTRFEVKGANQIVVGGTVTEAYFDYEQQAFIKTGSDPTGVYEPAGAGFHTIGSTFSTTASSPIQPQEAIKYVFKEFRLPDGSTSHNRDVWFTVNKSGDVTAVYDTYYLLHLKSDFPPVDDKSYHLAGSNAEYNLALPTVPIGGILGGLGGMLKPVNTSGTIAMTGPRTEEILWKTDLTWPIIFILLILLVIGGLCYFLYRLKSAPARQVTTKKKAPTPKAKSKQQQLTKTKVKSKQQAIKKTGGSRTTGRKAR